MKKLIIATRASKLALWQSNHIKSVLEAAHPGLEVELKPIKTTGDKILDTPLALIGGKGLFTKELEEDMLSGGSHMAVHSLKDVPTKFPDGLVLAAVTKREDPRDCFLSFKYATLEELPQGAVVGTTSLRRRMQLKAVRPDLSIKDLRGNIDTRLKKLEDGEFDAIILATAGIKRLGLIDGVKFAVPIERDVMTPSMGQAALGIESIDNDEVIELLSVLNDEDAMIETTIERDFVDTLEGGCQVPIGVNAKIMDDDRVEVLAIIGMPDGSEMMSKAVTADIEDYEEIGEELAREFLAEGADKLLAAACAMGEEILKK
ncbi:MAG: hydroxymethylbilane synthase [Campylobacterales bacterium]